MRNKLLEFVTANFINIGINVQEDTKNKELWKFIVTTVTLLMVLTSMCMSGIANRNDFQKLVEPTQFIATAAVLISGIQVTYFYRKTIGKMLRFLDTNLYVYPDEDLFEIEYAWYLQVNTIFKLSTFSVYAHISFLLLTIIPGLSELVYYRRIKTFLYPTWTPWRLDNIQTELLTFIIEILQAICGLIVNHIMIIFIVAVVVEFVKQYRRLNYAISSVTKRTSLSDRKAGQNEIMRENIIHCIRHYQALHKGFQFFKVWFTIFFSFELAICLVTIAFGLLVLVNATNLFEMWNFFLVYFFLWFNLLSTCLISEIFLYLNEHTAETIFWQIEWLKSNRTNRRLHLMFHQLAVIPQQLHGLWICEANRTTLRKIIKFNYSLFNFMNSSRK